MKHFNLDYHKSDCPCHEDNYEETKKHKYKHLMMFCDVNIESFVFYANNQFYLVTYKPCLSGLSGELNFIESILKVFSEKNELSEIKRSYKLNNDFKEYRLRGGNLNTSINEVNYIYSDNAGHEYCFTKQVDCLEIDDTLIKENYELSKKYLIENGYSYLLDDLLKLRNHNIIGNTLSSVEVSKSIDHTIKLIKKEINNRYKVKKV